jgi:hypothetical protein
LHISFAFVNLLSAAGQLRSWSNRPGHMFANALPPIVSRLIYPRRAPNFSPLLLFFETKAFKYAKFYRLLGCVVFYLNRKISRFRAIS